MSSFKLEAGRWGGSGINVEIDVAAAALEFPAAEAVIREAFTVDDEGRFDLAGEFRRRYPGPSRDSGLSRSARFSGIVNGDSMSLKIILTDTGETVGEFVLKRGQRRKIIRLL